MAIARKAKKVTKERVARRRASSVGRCRLSGEDKELLDEVLNIAVNDDDSYRSGRPCEAVDKAFETYRIYHIEHHEDTFRQIRKDAVIEIRDHWIESRKVEEV